MRELDKIVLFLISLIALMLTISVRYLIDRVDYLKYRIEELEQRELEAHEYILNRIGG